MTTGGGLNGESGHFFAFTDGNFADVFRADSDRRTHCRHRGNQHFNNLQIQPVSTSKAPSLTNSWKATYTISLQIRTNTGNKDCHNKDYQLDTGKLWGASSHVL